MACLSALRIHPLEVDCVRKMASESILHVVCVCINRIGTVDGSMAGISPAAAGGAKVDWTVGPAAAAQHCRHSSMRYRPPAPETIVMPSWPPGSAPPAIQLDRETVNALTFKLDQSTGAGQGWVGTRPRTRSAIRPSTGANRRRRWRSGTHCGTDISGPCVENSPIARGRVLHRRRSFRTRSG